MITLRETEKGRLLEYDGIQFWIMKKWQRADGTLTPAGKKAMAIAASYKRRYAGFDATKTFTVIRETDKAINLECKVKVPNENQYQNARFWMPRSMVNDHRFVSKKIKEIENSYPYAGTEVVWG